LISITRHPDEGVTAQGGTSAAHDMLATLGWIPQQAPGRLWQTLPPGLTPLEERKVASRTADLLYAAGHQVDLAPELDVEVEPLRLDAGSTAPTAGQTIAALTERLGHATSAAQIAEITAQITDGNDGALHHLFAFFGAAVEGIAAVTVFPTDPDSQVQARIDEVMQAAMVFTLDEAEIPAAFDHLMDAVVRVASEAPLSQPGPTPQQPAADDRPNRQSAAAPAHRPVAAGEAVSAPTAPTRPEANRRGTR